MLGVTPTKLPDIPISAVLLLLFAIGAASNMTIFQVNNRRNHKFAFSAATFGFCMARITASVLRIAWACHPSNISLTIAAMILVNAGVVILFVVNMVFFQRVLRSLHPHFGWSKTVGLVFKFLFFSIGACLIMVIVAGVYSFYTLDREVLAMIREVRLTAAVYLAVLAFIPIPGCILCLVFPRRQAVDKFGEGSMRTKITLLVFTATLLSLGAWFRAAIGFLPARPKSDPGWYNHRACFYCFNYVIELIVVFSYVLSRMDKRFWIPDGSSGPGHYSKGGPEKNVSLSEEAVIDIELQAGAEK